MAVGNADDLQEALQRAVLARPAVQHVERHVGLHGVEHGGDVAADVDARHAIAEPRERVRAGLARTAATPPARPTSRPSERRRACSCSLLQPELIRVRANRIEILRAVESSRSNCAKRVAAGRCAAVSGGRDRPESGSRHRARRGSGTCVPRPRPPRSRCARPARCLRRGRSPRARATRAAPARAQDPGRLEAAEGGREVAAGGVDQLRQAEPVLDRHAGALRQRLQRRMRGIAEQHDAALRPVPHRIAVADLPAPAEIHHREQVAHGRMGVAVGVLQARPDRTRRRPSGRGSRCGTRRRC